MMNSVQIIGRLTQDIEVKQTPNGKSVCAFTLAVNRKMQKDVTDWIPCQAWAGTADFLGNYGTKGRLLAVEGSIQTRSYESKEGKKVKVVEVNVQNVQFLDKGKSEPKQNDVWSDVGKEKNDDGPDW